MYKLFYAVARITEAFVEALEATLNDLKKRFSLSSKKCLSSARKEFNQMKNETASELADMHSSLHFIMANTQMEVVHGYSCWILLWTDFKQGLTQD